MLSDIITFTDLGEARLPVSEQSSCEITQATPFLPRTRKLPGYSALSYEIIQATPHSRPLTPESLVDEGYEESPHVPYKPSGSSQIKGKMKMQSRSPARQTSPIFGARGVRESGPSLTFSPPDISPFGAYNSQSDDTTAPRSNSKAYEQRHILEKPYHNPTVGLRTLNIARRRKPPGKLDVMVTTDNKPSFSQPSFDPGEPTPPYSASLCYPSHLIRREQTVSPWAEMETSDTKTGKLIGKLRKQRYKVIIHPSNKT